MKKTLAIALALMLCLGLLAACGSPTVVIYDGASTPAADPIASEEPSASEEPLEIPQGEIAMGFYMTAAPRIRPQRLQRRQRRSRGPRADERRYLCGHPQQRGRDCRLQDRRYPVQDQFRRRRPHHHRCRRAHPLQDGAAGRLRHALRLRHRPASGSSRWRPWSSTASARPPTRWPA